MNLNKLIVIIPYNNIFILINICFIWMERDIAKILLDVNAVALRPKEPFTYVSGIRSPIYCDNRLLMSYPEQREVVLKAFLEKLKDKEFDLLAGTATAGIPWCSWIAKELNKPMIYVRDKAKEHGKGNAIEGKLEKGQRVIVVEDLISTGGSSVSVVEEIRKAGGIVNECVAIFTYELEKSASKFKEANCIVTTLTNFSTLTEVASESGYIKPDEKSLVLGWKNDPESWAEKSGL